MVFPSFEVIRTQLESLLDWAIVSWWLDERAIMELRKFNKSAVLSSLQNRIATDHNIAERLYDLAAEVLGDFAENWILSEWQNTREDMQILARALAKCSSQRGFALYVERLEQSTSFRELNEQVLGLLWFRTRKSLVWMEQHVAKIETITDHWSLVAAASEMDWVTCERWLQAGRPLSLIALDTLLNFTVDQDTANGSLWLRENPQKLHAPISMKIMQKRVDAYIASDNFPRTRMRNEVIQDHWEKIIADKPGKLSRQV